MCKMEDTRNGRNSSNFYCRNYKTTSSKCTPHKIRTSDLDNMEENEDTVTLMTLHSAKGLEFPAVF